MRNITCRRNKIIRSLDAFLAGFNDPVMTRDILVALIAHYLRTTAKEPLELVLNGELRTFTQEVWFELLDRQGRTA